MRRFERARQWARAQKRELVAVFLAARDPRTPRLVKLLALAVVAYALSPIDLIPDAIPVLGLLDDLILVPLGLLWVVRLLPPEVLGAARARAGDGLALRPSRWAAAAIVGLWLLSAAALFWWWWR